MAFQMFHNIVVLFTERGASVHGITTFTQDMLSQEFYALFDSGPTIPQPCSMFIEMPMAFLVQATSPQIIQWKGWIKHKEGKEFWMECNSEDELMALG